MKKIGQWLLLHYPLIWNTRIYILLPFVLLLNVLFYLWGYNSVNNLKDLTYYNYFRSGGEEIIISLLVGVLTLITWLAFYLRQNAFKSYLPINNTYLIKEFFIILIAIAGVSFLMFSQGQGRIHKLRELSKDTNLIEEANLINIASHFLPFNTDDFNPNNYYNSPANKDSSNYTPVSAFSYLDYNRGPEIYSLNSVSKTSLKSDTVIRKTAHKLLLNHKSDTVKAIINRYLSICNKYGIEYRLDVDRLVNSIFATPDFRLNGKTIEQYGTEGDYVQSYNLNNAITTLDNAKHRNIMSLEDSICFIYWCLGCTIVLLSFRITQIKIWFISLITFGVLVILNILLMVSSEKDACMLLILQPIAAFILAFVYINKRRKKLVSGVCYLLALWSLTGFISVSYRLLVKLSDRIDYLSKTETDYYKPVYYIDYANFIFALLMIIFVMIPLAKKWQANPAE